MPKARGEQHHKSKLTAPMPKDESPARHRPPIDRELVDLLAEILLADLERFPPAPIDPPRRGGRPSSARHGSR